MKTNSGFISIVYYINGVTNEEESWKYQSLGFQVAYKKRRETISYRTDRNKKQTYLPALPPCFNKRLNVLLVVSSSLQMAKFLRLNTDCLHINPQILYLHPIFQEFRMCLSV
jgi:hypothetical protein